MILALLLGRCSGGSQGSDSSGGSDGALKWDANTVSDSATGLTWQRNLPATYAGCIGDLGGFRAVVHREEAKAYCTDLALVGVGWRLPTHDELLSIVDASHTDPSINPNAFPNTPSTFFWSSSLVVGLTDIAWGVHFSRGLSPSYGTDSAGRLRCVR